MRLLSFSSHHSSFSCIPHLQCSLLSQVLQPSKRAAALRLAWPRMNCTTANTTACRFHSHRRRKDQKVLVIMGATGTGKSRLSIDLTSRFFPCSEIINSDKMQVYRGLDITTNKISIAERRGVPHHLLGHFDPVQGEVSPTHFRSLGSSVISQISSRGNLPMIVGGSNSFIHSLLVDSFSPHFDPFEESSPPSTSISSRLRYNCCFIWVDVSFPVLTHYLSKRVDDMIDSGMVEELAEFYDPEAEDSEQESATRVGLRKAIGVPEFDRYFKKYPPPEGLKEMPKEEEAERDVLRRGAYEEAVRSIKDNTCRLVKRQLRRILRLRMVGWDLHRVNATEAFRAAMVTSGTGSVNESWAREVLEPSVKIVKRFLKE